MAPCLQLDRGSCRTVAKMPLVLRTEDKTQVVVDHLLGDSRRKNVRRIVGDLWDTCQMRSCQERDRSSYEAKWRRVKHEYGDILAILQMPAFLFRRSARRIIADDRTWHKYKDIRKPPP